MTSKIYVCGPAQVPMKRSLAMTHHRGCADPDPVFFRYCLSEFGSNYICRMCRAHWWYGPGAHWRNVLRRCSDANDALLARLDWEDARQQCGGYRYHRWNRMERGGRQCGQCGLLHPHTLYRRWRLAVKRNVARVGGG